MNHSSITPVFAPRRHSDTLTLRHSLPPLDPRPQTLDPLHPLAPCSLLLLLFLTLLPSLAAAKPPYLFTSFRGNGEDGLHLACSTDGLRWTDLGRSFLKPTVGISKLMRDPCLIQTPDKTFHMVWTTGWNERGIGYASSKDLLAWSTQKYIDVMAHEPAALNAWAPEIIYDQKNNQFLIYWSSTIPGRFPGDGAGVAKYNHRAYFTTTKDFAAFTPTKLFFDPGHNAIDATIIPHPTHTFLMVFKDERSDKRNLRTATTDNLLGPYANISDPFTPYMTEGPTILQLNDDYIIYFDMYGKHQYGAAKTRDFKSFTDITPQLSFPKDHRHGSVLPIPKTVLDTLQPSPK